ncbi:hypothetical protein BS47DRAFT_314666 [Hydnum rufescens UP504]|uniref:Uncharacterized protein n=1 Tax=Hydnum rufescens UP504 TaxID=1448309 RepID=A0A9P6DQH9_9AGAM|nr:hypothetical protein BS47DRAFT_314666 [Hydnum rufescens UP504]
MEITASSQSSHPSMPALSSSVSIAILSKGRRFTLSPVVSRSPVTPPPLVVLARPPRFAQTLSDPPEVRTTPKSFTGVFSEVNRGLTGTDGPGDTIVPTLSTALDAVIDVRVTIFIITSAHFCKVRGGLLNAHSLGMHGNNLSDSVRASISQS